MNRERQRDGAVFLETLSQELRDPLTALGNAAQVVLQAAGHDEHCRWAVSMLERQLERLTRVADDLLDLSQLAQGRLPMQLEGMDVEWALQVAAAAVEGELRLRGQRLLFWSPRSPLGVWGDHARMVQLFRVLLDSAVRNSDPGAVIRVSVTPEGSQVVVRIPTGEPVLGRRPGVGPTLVRRLLELQGGSIEGDGLADRDEQRAAAPEGEVVLRFPAHAGPLAWPGSARRPPPLPPIAGRRILVVDDHRDTADALARVLEVRGHRALAVHSGPSALEALEGFRPHAVLLDLGLPVMDGLEVARRIRARPDLHDLILIAATGHGEQEDRRRCHQAGFDHHLVKPLDAERIEALLRPATTA
jgi:CheY-like chemotaxis protein